MPDIREIAQQLKLLEVSDFEEKAKVREVFTIALAAAVCDPL